MASPSWVEDFIPRAVIWKGTLSAASASLAVGDWFCIDPSDLTGGTATRVTVDALAAAGAPLGIANVATLPGGAVSGYVAGFVPSAVTGLGAGAVEPVRVNTSTARSERVVSLAPTDYAAGISDTAGGLNAKIEVTLVGTLATPASPGDNNEVAYASAGDLAYADGVKIEASGNALTAATYIAIGAAPADSGGLRLSNGSANGINFESSPDGTDVVGMYVDSSEVLQILDGTGNLRINAASNYELDIAGIAYLTIAGGVFDFQAHELRTAGFVSIGTQGVGMASLGDLRTDSSFTFYGINEITNVKLLEWSAGTFTLGQDTNFTANYRATTSHTFYAGGSQILQLTSALAALSVVDLQFASTVVAPKITQSNDATNGITGDTLRIQAQNATGTTTTGGILDLRSGTGTTAAGDIHLYRGSTLNFVYGATSHIAYLNSLEEHRISGGSASGTTTLAIGNAKSTGAVAVELGGSRSGDGAAFIDFHSDAVWTDYSLRVVRNLGENGITEFAHRGTGQFRITATEAAAISFRTTAAERWTISSTGLLAPAADNTYALGSASLRVSTAHFAGAVQIGNSAGSAAATLNFATSSGVVDGFQINRASGVDGITTVFQKGAGDLRLGTAGTGVLDIFTNNASRWQFTDSALQPAADNTYTLGSSTRRLSNLFASAIINLDSANTTIRSATGSPEGVVTAPVGSLYLNRTGGASVTAYLKESGSGNTGWKAIITAA